MKREIAASRMGKLSAKPMAAGWQLSRNRLDRLGILALAICGCIGGGFLGLEAAAGEYTLAVHVTPRFNGRLTFDELCFTNFAGQALSVTRLDLLVSDFSLRRKDETWVQATNWQAYLGLRAGKCGFQVPSLASGAYDRIRFHIGLTPESNHANPAQFSPTHPLNPNVNGLHWSWQGGYVFLALEGHWKNLGGAPSLNPRTDIQPSGYSFHLATDRQLMTVELPVKLDLATDHKVQMALNVDHIFNSPNSIELTEENNSTHSRTNDSLALRLHENVENAFSVTGITASPAMKSLSTARTPREIAADAKPYRLTMSAFFPQPDLPKDNPLTVEGAELGRRLFFEPLLSINNSQSCASCHEPARAFSESKSTSTGAEGTKGTRNAMSLLNLAWKSSFFWDGRAATLREQVLQPIENPIEMHESLTNVVRKLNRSGGDYPILFKAAFGSPLITSDRIARALEQFLLTQMSYDSKFDRVVRGVDQFTAEEQRGFELFHTEYDPRREQYGADCFHCHGGPLFQSQTFANNGLDANPKDLGRYLTTAKEGDKGKFAVPSLRNVEVTGPYMHDGRFKTLEDAVEHYVGGVKPSSTLDPNLAKHPAGGVPLSAKDKRAVVSFLKTLTDERFRERDTSLAQN